MKGRCQKRRLKIKSDRLHPVISLCVYYGENQWDGPFSLKDMLEIPEKIKPLVSDYRMNLIQVRSSKSMRWNQNRREDR